DFRPGRTSVLVTAAGRSHPVARHETPGAHTMPITPEDPAIARPGRPPVADRAPWRAAGDELLVREKAHTREGDAIAAARRGLPMVEFDGSVSVVGADGRVAFRD